MTRFLKLVRHQNGKWQALPAEAELTPISINEKKDAPIDPAQLLKALAPLLSVDGGINSIDQAAQFSSLMKKFSKKLVSRCVYCNVLKSTKPEILTKFLDESGWNTINAWLQDAKENSNNPFLVELLKLCKILPMTVERLKENNTPKIVKALTKLDNEDIKSLSTELVTKWMTLIKGSDTVIEKIKKKKKLNKQSKDDKEQKDPQKDVLKAIKKNDKIFKEVEKPVKEPDKNVKDIEKAPAKINRNKRTSNEKDNTKSEVYEDVKLKIEPEPLPKKPKIDRPKTTKVYQKKFRATGLEEETPLPRNIPKKTPAVDKTVVAAAAKNAVVKRQISLSDRITEKKIKPESLLNVNETSNTGGGIKLIPAKPRPAHILHESASFMDALVAQPAAAPKRKKKIPNKVTTPPSPTMAPAKLQFYKDTLEINEENKEEVKPEANENTDKDEDKSPSSPPPDSQKESPNGHDEQEVRCSTPINDNVIEEEKKDTEDADVSKMEVDEEQPKSPTRNPNELRSILTHGKRRHKKKSVRWVEESELKQVYYFELDETERVNVLRVHNFGDMKSLEARREREAFEAAKRHAGDKMEESIPWWIVPILIDVPPPLVEPGCQSREKEIQKYRQQSTLQEIYFTRDMVPDSPQEPDLEVVTPQEPKIIPLDEENVVGSVIDYTQFEVPTVKHSLPEVLTSLMNIPSSRTSQQPNAINQVAIDVGIRPPQNSVNTPYDPGEPLGPSGLLGIPAPNQQQLYNSVTMSEPEKVNISGNWQPMDIGGMTPSDSFFVNYPVNPPMMIEPVPQIRGGIRPRLTPPVSGPPDMFHPSMNKQISRPMGPPNRGRVPHVPCRHFIAGSCRYGANCSFLHPGINGPPL